MRFPQLSTMANRMWLITSTTDLCAIGKGDGNNRRDYPSRGRSISTALRLPLCISAVCLLLLFPSDFFSHLGDWCRSQGYFFTRNRKEWRGAASTHANCTYDLLGSLAFPSTTRRGVLEQLVSFYFAVYLFTYFLFLSFFCLFVPPFRMYATR